MAEPQLQTITKHFQWSWEMPWIQSITSEAWITPLWRALPSDEPIFSASSAKFKDLRIRPLLRLGLLTPKIKNLSLFFFLTFLSLPCFRSVFQNIFRMIPSVFAHHRKCKSLLAGREPPLHSAHSGGSFPSVPSNTSELIVKCCLYELSYYFLPWGFLSFRSLEEKLFWRNLTHMLTHNIKCNWNVHSKLWLL